MATNIITASNSLSSGLVDNDANPFLLVTAGGYIVGTGSFTSGYLTSSGGGRITVDGSIVSRAYFGIYCTSTDGGNDIAVSSTGVVSGSVGIVTAGSINSIKNDGLILSSIDTGAGVVFSGDYSNTLDNSGSIKADVGVRSNSGDIDIRNDGSILSSDFSVYSDAGANLINFGMISGRMYVLTTLQVDNSGTIDGALSGNTAVMLTNTGTIDGALYHATSVTNSGTITGDVNAGAVLTMINSGMIDGSIFAYSTSTCAIFNYAQIHGDIVTGGANDSIDTSTGVISGSVYLASGADAYTGGAGIDRVDGGADNDDIDLGAGNDVYRAENTDGKDSVDGGDGVDRYDASSATQALTVDLSSETTSGTIGADSISGFENVTGGSAADTLTGDDGANRLDGYMGADTLNGGAGNDRLIGGTGTDTITGGAGRDIMTGGQNSGSTDSDSFVFRTGDSGVTAATRDRITDFTDHGSNTAPFATGADTINLSGIDANTNVTGDQAFSFNAVKGAAFSGNAGSLIWQQYTGYALVSGDTNGDGKADFTIQLNGTHTLFASDFVL